VVPEGIASSWNTNQQGILAGVLNAVLLKLCSCLRDLKQKHNI
jgi:hypothetical protein